MKQARLPRWAWLGLFMSAAGALVISAGGGPILSFRRGLLDLYVDSRTARPITGPDSPIALVGYDPASEQRYGRLIPRDAQARAIRKLTDDGAHAVILDFIYSERDPSALGIDRLVATAADVGEDGDALRDLAAMVDPDVALEETFRDTPAVPAFLSVTSASGYGTGLPPADSALDAKNCGRMRGYPVALANLPPFSAAAPIQGNALMDIDEDGTVRRYPLFARVGDRVFPSLGLVAAAIHLEALGAIAVDCDPSSDPAIVTAFNLGTYDGIPMSSTGEVMVDFQGSFDESFPDYVPFWEVAEGKFAPGRFRDRVVFLGHKSPLIDYFETATDERFPGFAIHATVANSLIRRHWTIRGSYTEWILEPLAALLAGLLGTLLLVSFQNAAVPIVAAFGLPVLGYQVSIWLASRGFLVEGLMPGMVGLLATVSCGIARFVGERQQRLATERELGRFLSPSVARIALQDPNLLAPSKREISILFSDIRGFTTTAEGMSPEELVKLLDEYLTSMTEIVFANRGTLDKYIGDAVMALFGAPVSDEHHAVQACETSLRMLEALGELQASWRERNLPVLEIGIGVNSGMVSVGRMGSRDKSEYTCIGDEVNFASRVEGLTKPYGARIIVGNNTFEAARDRFAFRDLGRVKVKGKKHSIAIHELIARRADMPEDPPWIEAFARALDYFYVREWERADAAFAKVIEMRGGSDGPAEAMMMWTRIYRDRPPPDDWDGSLERREK